MNGLQNERYSRQLQLQNFGAAAQQQLLGARVLVIGAGGLGCPALQYLAAAGVGIIGIADGDTVALSNLQRQVLYTTPDIGKYKVTIAAARLRQMNPDIVIREHPLYLDNRNALPLMRQYDYIIDGTDNFTARYLINDACVLLGKPLIFGAVYQYEGQVAVFNVADEEGVAINYRHLFPVPPQEMEAPDCATAGILGTLPGIIGVLQATETIKLITGIGETLNNKLLTWNALCNEAGIIDVTAAFHVVVDQPANENDYLDRDYAQHCHTVGATIKEIGAGKFRQLLGEVQATVIDVREAGELPLAHFPHQHIPLSEISMRKHEIVQDIVVLFCQRGGRSLKAAAILAKHLGSQAKIYSLYGGILSLET